MSKGPEQTFFQRRPVNGQQVYGKVLNITNRNRNENHSQISLLTYEDDQDYCQKDKRDQILVRVWRKGNPCTVLVGM